MSQFKEGACSKKFCKAKGKCCKLIIDSGSTDNLVSTKMVDKMNLKRTVNPKPYCWRSFCHHFWLIIYILNTCFVTFWLIFYHIVHHSLASMVIF